MLQNLLFNDLNAWLDYISQLHPKEMDLGLTRVNAVAQRLGCMTFLCPVITVTGTNGKGSCVKFLEEIYLAAGYQVGAFTSPHLMQFNERIRINNQYVSDQDLIQAFAIVEKTRGEISLSFFEFTFLAALILFQKTPLQVLILEVGLGGRLDAVNIIDADVAVVTTIHLDHLDWLGPDRSSIAKEKAGIFRQGRAVICGEPNPPDTLKAAAQQLQCRWYGLDEQFFFRTQEQEVWEWRSPHKILQNLPALQLKHQNASTSLMVVEALQDRLPVAKGAIRAGLAKAKLMGRFEKVMVKGVCCYLDVAHNPEGASWLAAQLSRVSKGKSLIAVFSMLGDKDIANTIKYLLDYIESWYVAELPVKRAATLERLRTDLGKLGLICRSFDSISLALATAIKTAKVQNRDVVVFGSFSTVAQARQYLIEEGCYERI